MLGVTNWKTTAGGMVSILGGISVLLHAYNTGTWDAQTIGTAIIAIGSGIAGLLAKDHNITNAPTPIQARKV